MAIKRMLENIQSLLNMYVETDTKRQVNELCILSAFHYHVYHRSLRSISLAGNPGLNR